MKSVDYLIIGGSAAGTTAAEAIRNLQPNSSITIVTDENHEEYSRVLLPHYIRGKVSRDAVFLKKSDWYGQKKIELVKGVRVQGLAVREKTVNLSNGEKIQYSKLLIAVGGKVIKLKAPGVENANILYMRTVEDADKIVKVASQSQKAVIIGGGFIGLEFCSCLRVNGVADVKVLVLEDYFWQGKLDEQSSRVLVATLEKNGVQVLTREEVTRFEKAGLHQGESFVKGFSLITKSGKSFTADAVGVGIGIKSDFSWLEGSGIKINRGIVTNEYLQTNVPDIYAAGDCAEFNDVVFERQHIMGNWANATSQGNAVGKTMAGEKTVFETASSYSINFFAPPNGGSCTFIGVTEEKFADEVISRGSVEACKMTRIFIKTIGNVMRIVGATVINDPAQVSPLTMAVKNKIDIAGYKDKLADSSFNLSLITV